MDRNKHCIKKYDRVMARVYDRSRNCLKSNSNVTRHERQSSVRVGGKASVSNVSSGVFNELPTVLNDYKGDSYCEKPAKRMVVAKPRRTIESLDPALSPPRLVELNKKICNFRVPGSAPSVLIREGDKWSDAHVRNCYSSRSHTRLKELKDEIKAYQEKEKLMKLRSHLYKSCGVVLDDVGCPVAHKAVQVETKADNEQTTDIDRSHQWNGREDAGTAVSDQQMRSGTHRYPVDRYLVENSKKIEMVNIIDEVIWNPEPALRPEDETILRKLHEMLQSTADNLKNISGELSKYHESGVQVKTMPTPLDEEFNEKVHIEEVVNAKFHGYKIVDKSSPYVPEYKPCNDEVDGIIPVKRLQKAKISNSALQVNPTPILKKPVINRNLGISRTKVIEINDKNRDSINKVKLNNGKVINTAPTVAYNEFSYIYVEPKKKEISQKTLQMQQMPSINIRSELKEQKVLNLDIVPEASDIKDKSTVKSNVAVVAMQHNTLPKEVPIKINRLVQYPRSDRNIPPTRKILKMSTCDSSGSTNNISSDTQIKLKPQKRMNTVLRYSPKNPARLDRSKKSAITKKDSEKRPRLNLDEWKKKLNVVYGPSTSKKTKAASKSTIKKASPKQSSIVSKQTSAINNAEYIPYSKLTLGGVRLSDIEKEISDIPNKNELALSPILDRILSSRENSFCKTSPIKHKPKHSPKILTTSDENLLQEVINIEKTVSETLSINLKKKKNKPITKSENNSNDDIGKNDSYIDDFEDEKSDDIGRSENGRVSSDKQSNDHLSSESNRNELDLDSSNNDDADDENPASLVSKQLQNETFTKTSNLSFKDSVDIFEYIHLIDTQDTATQINTSSKILPKETQTSPRNDKPNIQPIHNDLWASADPRDEVENMFKLEKDFIKKLIIDEYGDLLDKFAKPSTSNDKMEVSEKNISASQKNTQTSPAHMKSVMTSPTRMKTRTTSPFALSLPVDHQTSPLIIENNEAQHNIGIENDPEDLGISINLSSPRFSLRLPRNSREAPSYLKHGQTELKIDFKEHKGKINTLRKNTISSSSSVDADNSSSEVSSLGEVKIKKRFRKRIPSISEYSSSSSLSKFSCNLQSVGILPLKSEGEISLGLSAKKSERSSKSDGETSFGLIK